MPHSLCPSPIYQGEGLLHSAPPHEAPPHASYLGSNSIRLASIGASDSGTSGEGREGRVKRLQRTGPVGEGEGRGLTCCGLHRGGLLGWLRVHQDEGQLYRHVPGRERSRLWSLGTRQDLPPPPVLGLTLPGTPPASL